MANTISVLPTWTDTAGAVTSTISLDDVNWGADFRIKSNEPNRLVLTNLTTPLGYDEEVAYERRIVNDIYSNTSVDKALYAATRKGIQLHQSIRHVRKVTDSDNPSFEMALPSFVNVTFGAVQNSLFTTEMMVADIERAISMLYETAEALMSARVDALLRGSLKPKDL